MSPDFKNQNFKNAMEDYVSVDARIALARKKYGERLAIICEKPTFLMDKDGNHIAALIHCIVKVDDRILSTGNASTTELQEEKSIEAAESAAVGRALKHAGFAAKEEFLLDDTETEKQTNKSSKDTTKVTTTVETKESFPQVNKPQTKTEELKNKFFKDAPTGTKVTLNNLRRE